MVDRSRRLFWRDLIWSRQWETIHYSHELVLSPCIRMVIKTFPERRQPPLDLVRVSLDMIEGRGRAYLELSHYRLAEVLRSSVCS